MSLYTFVTIDSIAEIISNKSKELIKWAKIIAGMYMVKIKPTKVISQKDIAEW